MASGPWVNAGQAWAIIRAMPVTAVTTAIISSILSAIASAPSGGPVAIDTSTTAIQSDAQGGLRGIMYPPANGLVQIGNVVFQLSPSVQIRNLNNLIVQPAYIQQACLVRFQLDQQGNVFRAWMLPSAE